MNYVEDHQRAKTQWELKVMGEAGVLLFAMFESLKPYMRPGTSGIRIQEFCLSFCERNGLVPVLKGYRKFPEFICVSVNGTATHGIPDSRTLQASDIVTVDVSVSRKGLCADSAWTYAIGEADSETRALLSGAWRVCAASLAAARKFRKISMIGKSAQEAAKISDVFIIPQFGGHGIGRELHEPPRFAFLDAVQNGEVLKPGMAINIEPVVCRGDDVNVELDADGWAWKTRDGRRCAQFEHTVAFISDDESRILTLPDEGVLQSSWPPFF